MKPLKVLCQQKRKFLESMESEAGIKEALNTTSSPYLLHSIAEIKTESVSQICIVCESKHVSQNKQASGFAFVLM